MCLFDAVFSMCYKHFSMSTFQSYWKILNKSHQGPSIYASVNWGSIGSNNGFSPVQHQAIIWADDGAMSTEPLGYFDKRKCTLECHLQIGCNFVLSSMYSTLLWVCGRVCDVTFLSVTHQISFDYNETHTGVTFTNWDFLPRLMLHLVMKLLHADI